MLAASFGVLYLIGDRGQCGLGTSLRHLRFVHSERLKGSIVGCAGGREICCKEVSSDSERGITRRRNQKNVKRTAQGMGDT